MQFRKKPVVIEAAQWFKDGDHSAVQPYAGQQGIIKGIGPYGWVETLEGGHIVTPGDWIITGVKGEHYPCKPDIFAATYEPALADQLSAHAQIVRESGWTPGYGICQQTAPIETKRYDDGTKATGPAPLPELSPTEQDAKQSPRGDFGFALAALKAGQRVARAGWNGKGMFVYLVPSNSYPAQTGAAKAFFGEGGMVPYNAYLALKGADDTVSTWAPSGSDALAEDWLIVE